VSIDTATTPTSIDAPERPGIAESWHDYVARLRGGQLGSLPAILGLVALVILFTALKGDTFFTVFNLANLLQQSAMVMAIAMGLVFVLLLGEIDLAAGYTAGTSAAILGVTLTQKGWPLVPALLSCIVTGLVIGLVMGLLVARLRIPSFVVTLSFFLALQGLMLLIIGDGGTIPIRNETILKIQNGNLPVWAGWLLAVLIVGGYAATTLMARRTRVARGLSVPSVTVVALKLAALAVPVLVATYLLNGERSLRPQIISIKGVPNIVPIIAVFLLALTFVLGRTAFGRHVYAVGGNAEAARRAGINVPRIRVACFMVGSFMAAVAGILFASKDASISPSTGGSSTLLYAVGAAVIGGTSLFGGRGKVSDAVLGGLVVAVIGNGLPLITQESGIQFGVTGLVLLVAAGVDALSRRRSTSSG
jgi:D-xylose transport system permease protein